MDKQKEIELLKKYIEISNVSEQIFTLSVLVGEIVRADCSSPYFTDEIRSLIAAMAPDAARLEPLLLKMEKDLFAQTDNLEETLGFPWQKTLSRDLILEIYSREDVPDLVAAIEMAKA